MLSIDPQSQRVPLCRLREPCENETNQRALTFADDVRMKIHKKSRGIGAQWRNDGVRERIGERGTVVRSLFMMAAEYSQR